MSAYRKVLHSETPERERGLPGRLLQRFHKNQRGTTMTEFLITLPIFILIFVSMVRLGQFELTAGQLWGQAYQETWSKVLPVSQEQVIPLDSSYIHGSPGLAGTAARAQMSQHKVHNDISGIKTKAESLERTTYDGLASSGHWGESFQRVQPAANFLLFDGVGNDLTGQSSGVVGNSRYAQGLVDDSGGMVQIPNGGSGVAAAVGAGARYGTVFGVGKINPVIMGVNIPMYVHFNTLVAPMPYNDTAVTMEVSRRMMLKQTHYEHLLGISSSQPLSVVNSSISVPTLNKN